MVSSFLFVLTMKVLEGLVYRLSIDSIYLFQNFFFLTSNALIDVEVSARDISLVSDRHVVWEDSSVFLGLSGSGGNVGASIDAQCLRNLI